MSNPDAQPYNWHFIDIDDPDLEIHGRKLFFIVSLFAIILLATAIFLYSRWICRYRGLLPITFGNTQSRHAPPPPPTQGLDPALIKKLPIILHHTPSDPNGALEETECCICLSAFKDGEKLKVLPGCDHSFHCDCVDKWLTNHSSCPLCRASLKLVESSFPRVLIQEPPIRIDHRF